MKRFILTYKDENIFKDQRSFKSKSYAEKKAEKFREHNRACNSVGPNPKVEEIELEDEIDKLKKENEKLRNKLNQQRRSYKKLKIKYEEIKNGNSK